MPLMRRALVMATLVGVACSSSEPSSSTAPTNPGDTTALLCAAESKPCGAHCVPRNLPETGCGEASCVPCSLAHASATCSPDGRCVRLTCENGFGDCNASGEDGCELDVTSSDAHCGACGHACGASQICRKSSCVDRNVASAEAWLATQTEGWCAETYNQMLNLCGDVEFCFDPRFMRTYPTGIAVDVGFVWKAAGVRGNVVALGGDCEGQSFGIAVENLTLVAGGFSSGVIEVSLTPGKHLVSFQVNATGTALYVDGLRVGLGGAPTTEIRLRDSCGPGLVLGGRISYWWEPQQKTSWAHDAPFYVQLREGIADVKEYSAARATSAGPGTVFLFDKSGASGTQWKASVGGLVAVAKNTLDGTAQLDAAASGPLPAWKPFTDCALE